MSLMVKWSTITDDFPGSSLGAIWTGTYGTAPTVSGNKCSWPSGATYSGSGSLQYDLTNSSVLIKLDLATTTGLGYTALYLAGAGNVGMALIEFEAGKMTGYVYDGNWGGANSQSQITWATSASPVWVRFRHASGVLYLEYSTDGISWTILHNATPSAGLLTQLANCNIEQQVGPTLTAPARFSKLNLAPTAVAALPARVNATTTIPAPTPSATSLALPARVNGRVTIPTPVIAVGTAVVPARVNATTQVFLPNLTLANVQPNRVNATTTIFTPSLKATSSPVPGRVNASTVFFMPTLISTRLSTATPKFENPAPEDDGYVWRYNDTLGISELVPMETLSIGAVDIGDLSAGGTPDATTFLRGDNQWAVPPAKVPIVSSLPLASVSNRGWMLILAASGSPDVTVVCVRLADGTYEWKQATS